MSEANDPVSRFRRLRYRQGWGGVLRVFVPGGFFGLISFAFAMAWLNWIGRDLEETYGSHQLFGLYVLATLGAAATAIAWFAFSTGGMLPAFGSFTGIKVVRPSRGSQVFVVANGEVLRLPGRPR